MVKNWFCGICTPRPTDSGGESDDDGIIRKPNQNENEKLMDDFSRAGVDGGDGDIDSGTKNNPPKSPNEGKSDKREIDEDTSSEVPAAAASEVTKKKSGKKRNRGGGSDRKKEHPRPDSDDGIGRKEKEQREKPRKSSKDKDRRGSDEQKQKDHEEKSTQGQHFSSPEKKYKKKKKKTKKKKKKEEKDQEENIDNTVDEKDRKQEGTLEDKEIGSLNESLESINNAFEQRKVEKSSTVSNDSCSSESIKLPVAASENNLDRKTEDGDNYTTVTNDNERYEKSLSNSNDDIESYSNNEHPNDHDDESLNPDKIIFENESLSDVNCDNDSLDDTELFEVHTPNPRTKKQFLDAALTAKSLSDLNYVHSAQASKTGKSLSDIMFDDDDSLGDDEVFELDESIIPRPKKKFLEAALMAKSLSDLNFVHSDPASNTSKASRRKSLTDLEYDDDSSLGDDELFKLHPPSPRPKKQFLDAAMAAKSISDLNFVYSAQAPEVTTNQDSNHNYCNDSLDDFDLFPLEETIIPRPKKQFLEAALMAKSLSDLNYVHSGPTSNTSKASRRKSLTDLKYDDDNSLGDDELFKLHPPSPRPKKQFLDAALAAKSISDLNFVYSAQAPEVTISPNFDGDFSNGSLDDVQLFELDEPIPRPKKQFLDAALAAKSISDLNFVYSAQVPEVSTSIDFDGNCSHESLDDVQLFDVDEPIPRPKKQFLDAAMAAKSISDLNFVYSNQAPEVTTIEEFDGDTSTDSLDDVELFELDEPSPRPKKQFLDAALTAKSISDLNFVYSAVPELTTSQDFNCNSSNDSLDDVELFELDEPSPRPKKQFLDAALTAKSISDLNCVFSDQAPEVTTTQDLSGDSSNDSLGELFELDEPILRPKKQFLEAALMAKSLSDLNYVHSAEVPKVSRRKSLTDLNDDDRSLGDDEVFELHPPIPRPKKQFLEAALMAKSLSDLRYMHLVSTTVSNSKDSESSHDTSNIVPEHLLRLSQPNQFQTFDNHSIDDGNVFESVVEEQPTDKPILKAALEAKAQQDEGVEPVRNYDAPKDSSNDQQTEIVPEHLVVANQPATAHAHDNYSIEAEDIFDHSSGEQNPQKPLLKAALEARAQREEEYSKSLPCRTELSHQHFSKIVPDHLAVAHQPPKALGTLDELSIDNDRLFDSPEREGKNPLLMAALKAKEETHILQSPFSKSELEILKENDRICSDEDDKASDIFDETEGNDGGV